MCIYCYISVSQVVGRDPQAGRGAVLEGACMVQGNRYTYTIFIDDGLIYTYL